MNTLRNISTYLRFATGSKLLVATAFVLISGGLLAFTAFNQPQQAAASHGARDCDNNSIMHCGALTKDEFVTKYNENKPGDLKNIYNHYGLSQSELNEFKSKAKLGAVYKDGRVVVDGKTVATGAKSIGRHDMPGSTTVNINGKKYFLRSTQTSFASDHISAHVLMNGDTIEFIALTACGNPVVVKQPKYSCDSLQQKQIDRDTYEFTSKVTAKDGATLSKVVYDFGDGEKVEKTNPSEKVTHTYKPGKYTAKVTAHFTVNGKTKTHTSTECTKPVEVEKELKPAYECTALTARKLTRTRYGFMATASAENATLRDANFNFGDSQTANGIKPTDDNEIAIEHEYAKEGDYTITATLNFDVAGDVKSKRCEVKITVDNQPPKECKPGIPEGDERCEEQPQEEIPEELPSTGPAQLIGSALGISGIVTAGGYYLRSRRDLLNTIFKQ